MFCCACAGSCNHTGPCSYCEKHGGNFIPTSIPLPHPGVCPNCGHCPTCGRSNARPYTPWVQPWTQPWVNPWYDMGVTTVTIKQPDNLIYTIT